MSLLVDVDALCKLAHWDLLPELPNLTGCDWSAMSTVPSLRFRAQRATSAPDGKLFRHARAAKCVLDHLGRMASLPASDTAKLALFQDIPDIDAGVWIEFEHGDLDYPIWSGCYFLAMTDVPTETLVPPYQKVLLKTKGGHSIILDDTPGIGGITLSTAGGQKIKLTALGIEIDNGLGASIKMNQLTKVTINDGALEVLF